MKIDLKTDLDRKSKKTLACEWPKLIKKNRYFIPASIEDLSKTHGELKINGTIYFFWHDTMDLVNKFSLIIFKNSIVESLFSYDTIYESVVSEIGGVIAGNNKRFDDILYSISNNMNSRLDFYTFYFPVLGLKLETVDTFSIENVSIVNFNENLCLEILNRSVSQTDYDWYSRVQKHLTENFIQKSVVVVSIYGDRQTAEGHARKRARFVINYIRFVICLLTHERIDENLLKISLEFSWPNKNDPFFFETERNTEIFLANDRGRRPIQEYVFTQERLDELKKEAFFEDMSNFFFKDNKSDIESRIVTAIYWIGEAQNEYDKESAFLKFWIALESILTEKSDRKNISKNEDDKNTRITNSLCKGISVLLSCCGYEFIDYKEVKFTFNRVSELYNVRSNIVHQGVNENVNVKDLNDICRFSSWVVLCLLWLRNAYNIESIEEIKPQIDKLYDLQVAKPA